MDQDKPLCTDFFKCAKIYRYLPFVKYLSNTVLRSRSRWSRNYLGPGAGAKIKFLINIFCSKFGGCYDEDELISTSISLVLLF